MTCYIFVFCADGLFRFGTLCRVRDNEPSPLVPFLLHRTFCRELALKISVHGSIFAYLCYRHSLTFHLTTSRYEGSPCLGSFITEEGVICGRRRRQESQRSGDESVEAPKTLCWRVYRGQKEMLTSASQTPSRMPICGWNSRSRNTLHNRLGD